MAAEGPSRLVEIMSNQPFELPHAVAHILLGDDSEDVFTADQMQAYARAAVEAEREACARLCDPLNPPHDWTTYATTRAECASAIRARGKS